MIKGIIRVIIIDFDVPAYLFDAPAYFFEAPAYFLEAGMSKKNIDD